MILIWSAVVSLVTTLILFFTHSFWPVAVFYAIQGLFYAPYVPIAEAILITGVRRWGFDYGYLRMWGSIAFVCSTLLGGGLLELYGGAMVLPAMAVFFALAILVAISAPRLGSPATQQVSGPARIRPGEASPFWRLDFLLVIIGAALVQGSHGLLFGFATIYWTKHGISGFEISFLWTAGVVAEILLFYASGRYLARFSNFSLILFGCLVAVGRWSLFPLLDGFWPHLALQSMHAFTFAIIHVGIQRFMMAHVGDERGASAQGFYQFWVSLFNVLTAWSSGFIFQAYGVQGFYAMTTVAAAGVAFVVVALMLQPQSVRSGG
jgi:PPP family 3-phenylpropionic acid transporter